MEKISENKIAPARVKNVLATSLAADLSTLSGVGPNRLAELRARGLNTVGDLLEFFPRTYQRERAECPINELAEGQIQIARGEVVAVDYITASRPRFEATLQDPTGSLSLVWFNGAYLRRRIHPGQLLRVRGKVKFFRYMPSISQAKWEIVEPDAQRVGEDLIRAVYPASAKLSSLAVWKLIDKHIDSMLANVEEWFDTPLLRRRSLLPRKDAFRAIHQPTSWPEAAAARRRLVYDELMLMQIGLALAKRARTGRLTAPMLRLDKLLDNRIRQRFPYSLTSAQDSAIWQIVADLQKNQPMNRLLQGDVGSGKTAVALYTMLAAVANKLQSALLAPTEVLAEQHYLTLSNFLKDSQVHIELFTGRTKRESKGALLRHLSDGKIHIAVGTQALIQEDVEFANLGLVVVDEQHKLGVRQRATIKSKGYSPHYLIMTATPIPRTLALSFFADFDVSTIDALPPGRQPITTRWLRPAQSDHAYQLLRTHISAGRQAYIVMPQIEDSGLDDAKAVKSEFDRLSAGPLSPLAGLRLAMLHGQMKTHEKQSVMNEFRAGNIDVLVTTTVIEVGVDVPNATVILIEDADHFGLSQLHQLRGRVGRGTHPSFCLLIADTKTEDSEQRLLAMTRITNGFELAEQDLKLRGPGDFFGTRQHGLPAMKLADITQELGLLNQTKEDAMELLADDANLTKPEHQVLRAALLKQFGTDLALAGVG